MTNSAKWADFRRQMPITERFAYFDNAAVAPISCDAADAMRDYCRQAETLGDTVWPSWAKRVETVRRSAATMLAADPQEIALLNSTTAGINLVAEGFPWIPGDNMVTLADEFPTNQYPWLHLESRGIEVRRVESPPPDGLSALIQACDERTRLISVSWVSFSSGWRIDLDRLVESAHQRNVLVMLDAIQGLGVFPLNVRRTPIDFLSADGHKWLLGPEGAAIFFTQSRHLELLRPMNVGWNSVVDRMDYNKIELKIRPDAARYEGGSQNMVGITGLGASLDLLLRHGLGPDQSDLADRVISLTDYAMERLTELGARVATPRVPGHCSGIVSFEIPERESQWLRRRCLEKDVVLSCRNGRLRISVHAYNDVQDIDRLIDALRVVE